MSERATIGICLAAVYVIWGTTYLAMQHVLHAYPLFLSAGVRFLLSGIILYAVGLLRGVTIPTRRQWAYGLVGGFFNFTLGNILASAAVRQIPSGLAAVISATTPLIALVMGLGFGERPRRFEWIGLFIGIAGILWLGRTDLRAHPLPILMLCGSAMAWATGSLAQRRLPTAAAPFSQALQMTLGGVLLIGMSTARGEAFPTQWPLIPSLAFVYLAIMGSMVAFSAYTYLLAHTRPAIALSYAYVNPIVALLAGSLIGREKITLNVLVASMLVVGGLIVQGGKSSIFFALFRRARS